MDELALFETLRPDEPGLDAVARGRLRAELFATDTDTEGVDAVVTPLFAARRRRRDPMRPPVRRPGRGWRVAVAVAALVVAGVGATWAVVTRDTSIRPAHSPTATVPVDTTATPVPRVAIAAPGWRLTRATDFPGDAPVVVLLDPSRGPAGPSITVERGAEGTSQSLSSGSADVPIGSVVGRLSTDGDMSLVEWTDSSAHHWVADGWKVTEPALLAAAAAVTTGPDGTITLTAVPNGFELAPADLIAAYGTTSEYEFTRDDGTTLQINFYPGGAAAGASRSSDDLADRRDVVLGSEQVSLETYTGNDDGRFRADLVRGLWAWELDGQPFSSTDDFLNTVAAVRVVDEATWDAGLPAGITAGGTARQTAVDQLLAGVPVPDGFVIAHDGTADRYQLIVQTSSAVACAWLDRWFAATEQGDATAAAQAAGALSGSHDWPMLLEIADQGQWAQSVWAFADAVNGGPGVGSGDGPQPPTRAIAHDALGCA